MFLVPIRLAVLSALLLTAVLCSAAPSGSAGGTLVVLNKSDATASLIDLASGTVVATLPTGQAPHEAAVSPDGRTALATNYGTREAPGSTLTVIDLLGARVVKTIDLGPGRRPHGVRWLDARRAAVTAEGSKALLVVDVEKGAVETSIETGQEVSHMVAIAPDGTRAFVASIGSGTVTAIDLAQRKVLGQIATGKGSEGIAVTPDGKEVWVTNREADTVSVVDATGLKILAELPSKSFPIRVAFTADGRRALVSHARSSDIAVFDVAARTELSRMSAKLPTVASEGRVLAFPGGTPVGIVIEPAGQRAYVAHTNADAVAVFDLATGTVVATLKAGREPDGMAWSAVVVNRP
jgi:YVTN family beta-propeller protein